jgi:hypothetical protein
MLSGRWNYINTYSADPDFEALTRGLGKDYEIMEVALKDGRRLSHQTLAAKGTFENPLTRAEVEEKSLDLIAPILGKARSRTLMTALYAIEDLKDVRALRRLYAI